MSARAKLTLAAVAWAILGACFLVPPAKAADRTQRTLTADDITANSQCGASAVGKRRVGVMAYRIERRAERHKRVDVEGFWTSCGEYDCQDRDLGTIRQQTEAGKRTLIPTPRVLRNGDAGDTKVVRYGVAGPDPNAWIGSRTYTCRPPFWTTSDPLPTKAQP